MEEHAVLEDFVVGNRDLQRLEALLAEFNIFEAIGAVRQEFRHSDFLAFLLDPRANHRLGDAFLKRLLKHVLVTVREPAVRAVEIDATDLDDASVRREWQHIDILVHHPESRLICLIENKIGSTEHSNQLRRYRNTVQRYFADHRAVLVYLTPEGDEPSDDAYVPISYRDVTEVVDAVRTSRASTLGPDVRTLMEHYTTMLRRHIVADSEIAELCRKLYREHQEALDLIYEHRPDVQYDVYEHLMKIVQDSAEEHGLLRQHSGKSQIHFTVKDWDDCQAQHAGDGWGPRERMLTFRFYNDVDQVHLRFMIDSGPQPLREALFRQFQKRQGLFNLARGQAGKTEKTVYQRRYVLHPDDYEDPDLEQMKEKISDWWRAFLVGDLLRIKTAVGELPWEELGQIAERAESDRA
jgi:hypothetical protein